MRITSSPEVAGQRPLLIYGAGGHGREVASLIMAQNSARRPGVGYYDNRLRQLPDFDFWLRLLQNDDIFVLDKPLVGFR